MKYTIPFVIILILTACAPATFDVDSSTTPYLLGGVTVVWLLLNMRLASRNREKRRLEDQADQERRAHWESHKDVYDESVSRVMDLVKGCSTLSDMANLGYPKDTQLLMPPGEQIIFSIPVSATQDVQKTEVIRQRYRAAGFTFSFKIAGGLRYRSSTGDWKTSTESRAYVAKKDLGQGNLTLTNKRVIFDPVETTANNKVFTARTLLKAVPVSSDEFLFETKGKPILFDVVAESNPYCDSRVIWALIQKSFSL